MGAAYLLRYKFPIEIFDFKILSAKFYFFFISALPPSVIFAYIFDLIKPIYFFFPPATMIK